MNMNENPITTTISINYEYLTHNLHLRGCPDPSLKLILFLFASHMNLKTKYSSKTEGVAHLFACSQQA